MATASKKNSIGTGWKVLFGIIGLGLMTMLFFLVYGHQGLMDMQALKARSEEAVSQNRKLLEENVELLHQVKRLRDDKDYIEHVARQELHLVRPDETIIEIQR